MAVVNVLSVYYIVCGTAGIIKKKKTLLVYLETTQYVCIYICMYGWIDRGIVLWRMDGSDEMMNIQNTLCLNSIE